jgi:opacity protein-like surface antigen
MRSALALLLLAASPLAAQLHVGVKAGAPLNSLTETVAAPGLKNLPSHWTLGLMVDVDLPLGLGVEVDALYRRVGYQGEAGNAAPLPRNISTAEFTGSLWDFPVIGKYRFRDVPASPYLGAGWSHRRLNDLLRLTSGADGFVLAAGLRLNAIVVKISPELRYTRWTAPGVQPGFRASPNQAELLVGFSF